jgi:hypothetical protein
MNLSSLIADVPCDYRFFIDVNKANASEALLEESSSFNDIVLRDSCALMTRHPPHINYGSIPLALNASKFDKSEYFYRRVYKIDWKVCFLRWMKENLRMAEYIVFIEDDSFTCIENLMFQINELNKLKKSKNSLVFRTVKKILDNHSHLYIHINISYIYIYIYIYITYK